MSETKYTHTFFIGGRMSVKLIAKDAKKTVLTQLEMLSNKLLERSKGYREKDFNQDSHIRIVF
jgi:hypothetical protein